MNGNKNIGVNGTGSRRFGYEFIWAPVSENNNITFALSKNISPYMEINNDFINESFDKNHDFIVEINPYIRFDSIFSDYIQSLNEIELDSGKNYLNKIEFKKNLEHCFFSYLRNLDYITGTTIVDIYCEYIINDIKNGIFGEKILKYFLKLNVENQKTVSLLIYNNILLKMENRKSLETGIKYFFPDSIIYMSKVEEKKIIVYLNYKKNEKNIYIIKILKKLFLPLGVKMKCYWKFHFGAIGVPQTMIIDETAVY